MNPATGQYGPVAVTLLVAAILGVVNLTIGALIRPRRPNPEKAIPYECGKDPLGDPNRPLSARYWFMAMLLVLFDVEAVFLVPWALNAGVLGWGGFAAVVLFFLVLAIGYLYLWRAGDLEWR